MNNTERAGIAVCGNMLVDRILTVSRYPKEGELIPVMEVEESVGGAVPNVAVDLKRLSPPLGVYACGRIGTDELGDLVLSTLVENGVNTDGVIRDNTRKTTFSEVISVRGGQRTFLTYSGADSLFESSDVDIESLKVKILYLGYFLLLDRIDRGEGLRLLKAAKAAGIETVIDLVSRPGESTAHVRECLPYVDDLIINELEAQMLTGSEGCDDLPSMAEALLSSGVGKRVIIHCKDSAVCLSAYGLTKIASYDLPEGYIKGSTGAGDAFLAGALLAIHEGRDDMEILKTAIACAAVSLSSVSATGAMTDEESVKKITKKFGRKNICL